MFAIRVDRRLVARSAPLYGDDTTTMVVGLSRYEDRTVVVNVRVNGRLLGRRTMTVNGQQSAPGGGGPVPIGSN